MITDQGSDPLDQPTARTASASLAAFLEANPLFETEPIDWYVQSDGIVRACAHYLSPESSRLVSEMAQALGAQVQESTVGGTPSGKVRLFASEAVFDGADWQVRGYLPMETEDATAVTADAA